MRRMLRVSVSVPPSRAQSSKSIFRQLSPLLFNPSAVIDARHCQHCRRDTRERSQAEGHAHTNIIRKAEAASD